MKEKIIFHHPLPIEQNATSGSGIRPYEMYKAFIELGYEVELVDGYSHQRRQAMKRIKEKIRKGEVYKLCYSESSTMPLAMTDLDHFPRAPLLDPLFFKFLKEKNIPLGVFYRDVYWNFKSEKSKSITSTLKKMIAYLAYRYETLSYSLLAKVVFLPSIEMFNYIPDISIHQVKQLPPGLEERYKIKKRIDKPLQLLYVGGVQGFYNIDLLVSTVKMHFEKEIFLTICTRRQDVDNTCFVSRVSSSNVKVVFFSGKELEDLYRNTDCACLYMKPTKYRTFAVPIKLFEYISFSKPIIANKETWAGDFVDKEGIGWSIDYGQESLIKLLTYLINNKEAINIKSKVVKEASCNHLWINRCETVVEALG